MDLSSNQIHFRKRLEWYLVSGFLYFLLVFQFGLFALVAAYLLNHLPVSRRDRAILRFVSAAISLPLFLFRANYLSFWLNPRLSWWLSIPLFPLVSILLDGATMFSRFLKPKTQQEQLAELERREAAELAQLAQLADKRTEIHEKTAVLRLGAKIKGDNFPAHLGISQQKGWLTIDESVLDQHLFVLGTTGAGKSEAIKRLLYEILQATDRHIYVVDGKGDEQLANDIRSLAFHHQRWNAPVFKLGFDRFGAVYDGFRGQPTDIYNRLCALIGISDAEGDAQFYADINRDLLQLICYAPNGAPQNFEQLRERLSKRWLIQAYKDDPLELQGIEELDAKHLQGLAHRLRPLAREFRPCIGDEGFALETTACAIFSLRVQSIGDTAQRFLDFLVEDLKDFIGKRQTHPSVLIIDEFGQFSNNNITALLSLARSSKLAVILATQDVASLRDEKTKKLVLANTRTKLLMASDFPEDVAQLAGTTYQIESSLQFHEGGATGLGSARVQHAFKVNMNEAAKLQPGEAFLIRQRHVAKIKIRQIPDVVQVAPQTEKKRQQKPTQKHIQRKKKKRPRSLD